MRPLSKRNRELLCTRRICDVNEPWIDGILPAIPHYGQRVLVPARLITCFAGITSQGGSILNPQLRRVVLTLARTKVGRMYRATALPSLAPKGYSCSTLTYWVYAFIGLDLSRYAIDQSHIGKRVLVPVPAGFAFYENSFPIRDPDRAIGHVAITISANMVIHGSSRLGKVIEESLPNGAILYTDPIPNEPQRLIIIPPKIEGVFTALDLARWLERPPRF